MGGGEDRDGKAARNAEGKSAGPRDARCLVMFRAPGHPSVSRPTASRPDEPHHRLPPWPSSSSPPPPNRAAVELTGLERIAQLRVRLHGFDRDRNPIAAPTPPQRPPGATGGPARPRTRPYGRGRPARPPLPSPGGGVRGTPATGGEGDDPRPPRRRRAVRAGGASRAHPGGADGAVPARGPAARRHPAGLPAHRPSTRPRHRVRRADSARPARGWPSASPRPRSTPPGRPQPRATPRRPQSRSAPAGLSSRKPPDWCCHSFA